MEKYAMIKLDTSDLVYFFNRLNFIQSINKNYFLIHVLHDHGSRILEPKYKNSDMMWP